MQDKAKLERALKDIVIGKLLCKVTVLPLGRSDKPRSANTAAIAIWLPVID